MREHGGDRRAAAVCKTVARSGCVGSSPTAPTTKEVHNEGITNTNPDYRSLPSLH